MAQAPSRLAQARPVPHIVTELPGPRARAQIEFDHSVTSPSLPRAYPIVPVRGDGLAVEDVDGNLFLDFAAGIAVTSTGHSHPAVVARVQRQAENLLHFSASDFYLPIYADTCAELARISPFSGPVRVYLGNSGTEVVEAAIKLARYATKRPYVVAFLGAFHGRTYGSVSLTASKAKYHAGFGPLLPGVFHAPYGRVEDLRWFDEVLFEKLVPASEIAAIIVEPIQGEGGYLVPEDGFLQGLRRICDRHGILLIADEVVTGFGRTGSLFGARGWGVKPDFMCLAKGLTSGYVPLGATVFNARVADAFESNADFFGLTMHGYTYAGHPVGCAAAIASLDIVFAEDLPGNAGKQGAYLLSSLKPFVDRFEAVGDVRGKGLMVAIDLVNDKRTREPINPMLGYAYNVAEAARCHGAIVRPVGTKIILSPPLVMQAPEIDRIVAALDAAFAEVPFTR